MAISLQQAIDYSKANPTSDYAQKIGTAIKNGSFDQIAQQQGVDLSWAGRPGLTKTPTETPAPKLGQGAAGEFAGEAIKKAAAPLISTGAAIEKGLGAVVGAIPGVHMGEDKLQQGAEQTAQEAMKTPESLAGKAGALVGTIAPYFTGAGEEETAAQVASMVPKLAEKLGVSAESLIPKVVGYLAKHAPSAIKNTAIGTAQTGDLTQGAEIGVGGEAAGSVLPEVAKAATKFGTETLGMTTGAGASSLKAGYESAKSGSTAFADAMRGKTDPDSVVRDVTDAVQIIANNRRSQYISSLENLKQEKGSLDISPVLDTLQAQLKNFGVKVSGDGSLDFSRSSIANNGTARSDIQGVYDTLKDWGKQAGDRTPIGLDTLKKQLGDFYSQSGSARAFVQAVKGKVGEVLQGVPGYAEMTKNYSKASSLLDDIRSATGAGGTAKADTVFTKLTSAMKGDKEFRLEVLKEMTKAADVPDLEAKIAGLNMSPATPRGFIGRGTDAAAIFGLMTHLFNPQLIPALVTTSPRAVGEFVNALGVSAKYAKPLTDLITAASRGITTGTAAEVLNKPSNEESSDQTSNE